MMLGENNNVLCDKKRGTLSFFLENGRQFKGLDGFQKILSKTSLAIINEKLGHKLKPQKPVNSNVKG